MERRSFSRIVSCAGRSGGRAFYVQHVNGGPGGIARGGFLCGAWLSYWREVGNDRGLDAEPGRGLDPRSARGGMAATLGKVTRPLPRVAARYQPR